MRRPRRNHSANSSPGGDPRREDGCRDCRAPRGAPQPGDQLEERATAKGGGSTGCPWTIESLSGPYFRALKDVRPLICARWVSGRSMAERTGLESWEAVEESLTY